MPNILSRITSKIRPGRSEEKSNPVLAGMTFMDNGTQPRSMPRNYKSYVREGYQANDTLYKVCRYAMMNGAAIPPVLFADKSQINKPDSKRIEKHPLLERLEHPNPEWTGVFYRQAVIGSYLIAGNSFLYMDRVAKNGPPDELWILPPDRVQPIHDQTRITGYKYEDWADSKNPIDPRLIGHLRMWNPENPFFGMSPVQVAAIMIDMQTDARKWNLSLFQNFLKPPGAWTTDILLSPNERKKLEERVNEKMAGYRNAGKAPVLDGALKWQSSAVAPSEMDWIGSMKFNSGSIANIYNMPPQLIGDTSSTTYDNYEQAEVVSYTEFIFPVLDDFYGLLNMWLVPLYPDLAKSGAYLYYDKETVEVIQKVIQAQKTAQAQRATQSFMQGVCMLDEARKMQGLEPLPGGMGQIFRYGNILVPANKLMEYAEQSLTTPAGPPMPQAEPLSSPQEAPSTPTSVQQQQENDEDEKKPASSGEKPGNVEKKPPEDENKARKWAKPDTDWIPSDLDQRLDEYRKQGVTYLTWHCDGNPCEQCRLNEGVEVELGMPFPSGALLPGQHPNCMCTVTTFSGYVLKQRRREDYKRFIEEVLI